MSTFISPHIRTIAAYIIGAALGDGNLSCPNRRTTRLRITCDSRYPKLADEIVTNLKLLFPKNKVALVRRRKNTCFDISIYTNGLNQLLPWQVNQGTKFSQGAHAPQWIFTNKDTIRSCLKGLIQTDGSIYSDRGYVMVNFSNNIKALAVDVENMIIALGYAPRLYETPQKSGKPKFTVRLTKNVGKFIEEIQLTKS